MPDSFVLPRHCPEDYQCPDQLRVLYDQPAISARIDELAKAMAAQCGREFLMVGLLKGSFMFAADLIRALHQHYCTPQIDFMTLSSYGSGKISSKKVEVMANITDKVSGRTVILVDDILESGNTLHTATGLLYDAGADDVRICVLLDKPGKRQRDITADFTGFTIEDTFVVGYGLDYAGFYRELPFIGALDS